MLYSAANVLSLVLDIVCDCFFSLTSQQALVRQNLTQFVDKQLEVIFVFFFNGAINKYAHKRKKKKPTVRHLITVLRVLGADVWQRVGKVDQHRDALLFRTNEPHRQHAFAVCLFQFDIESSLVEDTKVLLDGKVDHDRLDQRARRIGATDGNPQPVQLSRETAIVKDRLFMLRIRQKEIKQFPTREKFLILV